MGDIEEKGRLAFRDFATDGVPASGVHEPDKADVRDVFRQIDQDVESLQQGQVGGGVVFADLVSLEAALDYEEHQRAEVLADATTANNGVYAKTGESGAGGWVKISDAGYVGLQQSVNTLAASQADQDATLAGHDAALTAQGSAIDGLSDAVSGQGDVLIGLGSGVSSLAGHLEATDQIVDQAGHEVLSLGERLGGEDAIRGAVMAGIDPTGRVLWQFSRNGQYKIASLQLLNRVPDEDDYRNGATPIIQSEEGYALVAVDKQGRLAVNGLLLPPYLGPAEDYSRYLLPLTTKNGKLLWGYDPTTGHAEGILSPETLMRSAAVGGAAGAVFGRQMTSRDLVIVIGYGQSLSIGGGHGLDYPNAQGPLSPSPPFIVHALSPRMLMPSIGMIGVEEAVLDPADIVDLVPARESWRIIPSGSQVRGLGQSQGSGLMMQAEHLRRLQGGLDYQVYHSCGRGGWTIAQLGPSSQPFANAIATVRRLVELAKVYKLTPVIRGVTLTQGDADRKDQTDPEVYKTRLVGLQGAFDAELQEILPRETPYKLFVDQLSAGIVFPGGGPITGHPGWAGPIAQAQLEAAQEHEHIILSGPEYMYERVDEGHASAAGYDLIGERHAHKLHEVEVLGGSGDACWMTSTSRSGTTITVNVNVPNGELVFDEKTVTAQANKGFVHSAANITAVTLADPVNGVIEVELDAAVAGTLSYADTGPGVTPDPATGISPHAGAWGNVRDGRGAEQISVTQPGKIVANWLCSFSTTVS